MPVLEVHGLRVAAGATPLVRGADLTVGHEERVAVLGASGSGKSLTVAAVLGLLPPALAATGSIRVAGTEVLGTPAARRRPEQRPGAVRQDSAGALHPLLTVGHQLALPLTGTRRARRGVVEEALRSLGLPDPGRIAASLPSELSGGQRQRVCLALALTTTSPLLVADEPTTALDVVTQAGVVELLRARTGHGTGRALLFVTHDLPVAAALCESVVVLDAGRVVERGPREEVLRAPQHPRTQALVAAARAAQSALLRCRTGAAVA